MTDVTMIGVDLAERVFQVHGSRADGSVAFRGIPSREKLLRFLAAQPRCTVAMEACATAHGWGREIEKPGHAVRLVPPICVKRRKNDAADAEAVAEAASRPTMRFVSVKTEGRQARAMLFRTRDPLVRQRTQPIDALRGRLAEHGVAAPQGSAHLERLADVIGDPQRRSPPVVRELGAVLLGQIDDLGRRAQQLEKRMRAAAAEAEPTRRLQTMPGVGPVTAMAIETFAPPMTAFRRARDCAAWLGLVPRQHSTGGKQRLGKTSKTGRRDIRRSLVIGAMAVIRTASRNGAREGSWLARMLERKPRMLVAVALADKMAGGLRAMMTTKEDCRDPAMATA